MCVCVCVCVCTHPHKCVMSYACTLISKFNMRVPIMSVYMFTCVLSINVLWHIQYPYIDNRKLCTENKIRKI